MFNHCILIQIPLGWLLFQTGLSEFALTEEVPSVTFMRHILTQRTQRNGKKLWSNYVSRPHLLQQYSMWYQRFDVIGFFAVSQDPNNYRDAPTEGIRRVLEIVTGEQIPRGNILNTDKIGMS